jgi:phospholipid/cholesterol/gamma-HCH transport system substrate-binding protein
MNRRLDQSLLGNPVLIGALTVLVTIVAVTLAYNANNGLPFVPRYTLNVQIRNAAELTHGADVRIGGALVGVVDTVTASRDSQGRPLAVLNVKLQESVKPLPIDTTFTVRLKGAIGLKYLQITPGHATRGWADGATVPYTQSSAEVDLDQVLSMFTPPTRVGVAASTIGFGSALAGRGPDINNAIGAFVPLLINLEPVARNLASSQTDLGGFFRGLEQFSGSVAPVAQTQADLYANLDTTFTALASVARPFLQDWISETPPTFSTVIADTPVIRPFLTDTATLFADSLPGAQTLPQTAPVLAQAFAIGTRTLPGTVALDQRTVTLSRQVAEFGQNASVQAGLSRLTLTFSSLRSPLQFLTPVQSTCNYVTLFLRNTSSLLSEHNSRGTFLRFVQIAIDDFPGSEGSPSQKPYTGPVGNAHGPVHVNPYPNTASPGEHPTECAAGNETFPPNHAVFGNPPGNLGTKTEVTTKSKQ